ncbi:MAG: signal peptide peptidase SppA [Abditibacteriota bacterium]|nr:signal peptide peptidase SppA [Abditibacteriota bacterium]
MEQEEITSFAPKLPPEEKPTIWQKTWVQIAIFIAAMVLVAVLVTRSGPGLPATAGSDHIAVVRVTGVMLTGDGEGGLLGMSDAAYSGQIASEIREAADDGSCKGIVLKINSPGGTPVAAEEISEAIAVAQKAGKPVFACMEDEAASAAYWISARCDKIYAYRTTITGSIGVIMHGYNVSELMKALGVTSQTVKAGKYKDVGSMDRPMTAEEKQMLQAMINTTYDTFIDEVARGRKLTPDRVRQLAEGRVYSGVQAKKVKLVDEIGTCSDCLADIGRKTGLGSEPDTVVSEGKPNLYRTIFGSLRIDPETLISRLAESMAKEMTLR